MTADFSAKGRAAYLERMAAEAFDVLVVGGGVVGAGIARDAALRGLRTALVERGDFASGTSGKTSRLVHGGLRYLKNGKVGLVRMAVRERDRLLRRAPGLVRPLAFTLPSYRGKGMGPLTLRFGLFLYDVLSKDRVLPRRRWLGPGEVTRREPRLRGDGLLGGGVYHDAITDDARLVLAIVRAAADAGAVVANYAEVVQLRREGGRVVGATVRDRLRDRTMDVRASIVVNATGVWMGRLRAAASDTAPVRPTKGIHVFLPRERVGNREAVVLSAKRDGRMLFVLPWGDLTLVGTTDTFWEGDPDRVVPDAEDVAYLLESVNEAFPQARVRPEDVVSGYAGLRPLLREASPRKESDISREHEVFEDPDGLLSVAGGKLTTQRAMAEEVVDRICRRLGRHAPCATRDAWTGPPADAETAYREMGFEPALAAHLAGRHDPAQFVRWLEEPLARDPVVPGWRYVWAEVDAAVEEEMAMTLADVMVRRLGLFYETRDQGLSVAPAVAARMARHLGWDAQRIRDEVRRYEELVRDHRRFREGHVA